MAWRRGRAFQAEDGICSGTGKVCHGKILPAGRRAKGKQKVSWHR